MKSTELEPIRDLLVQAYGTTMGSGSKPETVQDIESFEQKYQVKLPAVYRALLLEFGACNFGDPALFSAKELGLGVSRVYGCISRVRARIRHARRASAFSNRWIR
ncbi:SMI1/KNR4 family protein [Paenibacillus amylolyticus]|uniref:SMI1/KNR4 family protein n=1 Tax=Paenibacillus amylolyticus TaxID=1451 RepID=UPI003EC0215C